MIGKTQAEVAQMMTRFTAAYSQSPPSTPPSTPSHVPPPQSPAPSMNGAPTPPNVEDLRYDPEKYHRDSFAYNQYLTQTQMAQYAAPFASQFADIALRQSKSGTHADVWRRFEPEIMAEIASIPSAQWTVSLLDKAAEIVQGRHWREFAQEEVQRIASTQGFGTERANAPGAPSAPLQGDALDEAWDTDSAYFVKARSEGLTKADLRELMRKLKLAPEAFVKSVTNDSLLATKGGFSRTPARAY